MKSSAFQKTLGAALVIALATSAVARGGYLTFTDETSFKAAAGLVTMESFETIKHDSWIYDTRLPSPIVALDLYDDPTDPNDGPDYDLDGHFRITGNSIAYAPADELFKVYDYGDTPPLPPVDGGQFLSFSPWYNFLWANPFDPNDQHPIVTFDNFHNQFDAITAFGFYLYNYDPDTPWLVLELGDDFIDVSLPASNPAGNYFIGVVGVNEAWQHVQLHTNQNGSQINIDEVYFSGVPEPCSLGLVVLGIATLALRRRRS